MSVRKKELCDSCQKEKIEPGAEGVYLGDYLGNKTNRIHICENCYRSKEKEYLKKYAFIYTYEQEFRKRDTGYLKADEMKCYADKKDEDGKILKQKDCSHCSPWKQKGSKKILAEKLKEILNSPDYVDMPDLISNNSNYGDMFVYKSDVVEKNSFISGTKINPCPNHQKGNENIVHYEELEAEDWEEIVSLIKQKNQIKKQNFQIKKKNIERKLNSQPNLYYYWGNQPNSWHGRASCWVESKGMRGYTTFSGKLNNRGYGLYIAENHPILDNFPFEAGFYLVDTNKPIERNSPRYWSDGGESNPSNFTRYVELGDNVTITPYDKINSLIHIFQDQNVEQITLTNEGNLMIEYSQGNSNTISSQQIDNNPEFNAVRNYFRENNKLSLNRRDLDALLANSIQWPSSSGENNLGKTVIGIGLVLVVSLFVGLLFRSKRIKKH